MDFENLSANLDDIFSKYSNIEKKIHISWKNKDIINKNYSIIQNGILQLKLLNPDYEFNIYDDDDIDKYIQSNISPADYNLIKNKKIVEKTDLWRLLIIYNEGGIYCDIDRFCNIPLSNVITENIKCILPMYYDDDFSQDIIISCSQNIIHKKAIELNLERRRNKVTDLYYLGPTTYMHAVTEVLLGKQLNRKPSMDNVILLRKLIDNCKYLKTYRETPFFNTILYQGKSLQMDKNIMYKNENVKHWSK